MGLRGLISMRHSHQAAKEGQGQTAYTRLQRRLQRIEKLDPKVKRQIAQVLDTFIEREELKQRVNVQEN